MDGLMERWVNNEWSRVLTDYHMAAAATMFYRTEKMCSRKVNWRESSALAEVLSSSSTSVANFDPRPLYTYGTYYTF